MFHKNKAKNVFGKFRQNQTGPFNANPKSEYESHRTDANPNKESIDLALFLKSIFFNRFSFDQEITSSNNESTTTQVQHDPRDAANLLLRTKTIFITSADDLNKLSVTLPMPTFESDLGSPRNLALSSKK